MYSLTTSSLHMQHRNSSSLPGGGRRIPASSSIIFQTDGHRAMWFRLSCPRPQNLQRPRCWYLPEVHHPLQTVWSKAAPTRGVTRELTFCIAEMARATLAREKSKKDKRCIRRPRWIVIGPIDDCRNKEIATFCHEPVLLSSSLASAALCHRTY